MVLYLCGWEWFLAKLNQKGHTHHGHIFIENFADPVNFVACLFVLAFVASGIRLFTR